MALDLLTSCNKIKAEEDEREQRRTKPSLPLVAVGEKMTLM